MGWIARIRRRRWTMQAQTMELRPPQSLRRQPALSCHAGASPTAVSLIPATSRLSPRRKPGPIFQRPVFMDPDFRRGDNGEWDSTKSATSNAASLRLSVSAVDLSASRWTWGGSLGFAAAAGPRPQPLRRTRTIILPTQWTQPHRRRPVPSSLVTRIDFVDAAQKRSEQLAIGGVARLKLTRHLRRAFEHLRGQRDQRLACRLRGLLNLASPLDRPHAQERLRHRAAADQQAVVAQDQVALVAEGVHEARFFVVTHGDALEVVVGDMAMHQGGVEVVRGQAVALARDRHARGRVRVHDAVRVLARRMDRRMNDEPGTIDRPFARADQIAVEIDLDQVRCGDLAVPEAVGIDEEVPLRAGHA